MFTKKTSISDLSKISPGKIPQSIVAHIFKVRISSMRTIPFTVDYKMLVSINFIKL